MLALKNVKL